MLVDVTQSRRKLKLPKVKVWTFEKGEWGYYQRNATARNIAGILTVKSSPERHPVIAYKGYEYRPKEFLKKYPRYNPR